MLLFKNVLVTNHFFYLIMAHITHAKFYSLTFSCLVKKIHFLFQENPLSLFLFCICLSVCFYNKNTSCELGIPPCSWKLSRILESSKNIFMEKKNTSLHSSLSLRRLKMPLGMFSIIFGERNCHCSKKYEKSLDWLTNQNAKKAPA